MNNSTTLILPPEPLTRQQLVDTLFGDVFDVSEFPEVHTGLVNYLFNRSFRLLREGAVLNPKYNDLDFNVNTPFELLPHSLQLRLFKIVNEMIESDKQVRGRKIYSAGPQNIMRARIYPDYLAHGNVLHYIANGKKHFTIPERIKYMSNDCINPESKLTELTLTDKLSYDALGAESDFITPVGMMACMPNLNRISFLNQKHSIERNSAFGLGDDEYLWRVNNLLGTDITYCINKKCQRGFIQVDKSNTGTQFRYDLLNHELSNSSAKNLHNIKHLFYRDKDLVVYKNQIHISDIGHFYNVLCDLNNPNSDLFNKLCVNDWANLHHIFRSIGVQSGLYSHNICETYSLNSEKKYNRLMNPGVIFDHLLNCLTMEYPSKYFIGRRSDFESLTELMHLIKEFQSHIRPVESIRQFIDNCR